MSHRSDPGILQTWNLRAVVADPDKVWELDPICLKLHLVLCLVSGLVCSPPHLVKGCVDRQTYKQPAFIFLRATWQQRAQLSGHNPPISLLSSFIFPVIAPPCWRGGSEGSRGAFKSLWCIFTASSLLTCSCFLCLVNWLNAAAEGAFMSICL